MKTNSFEFAYEVYDSIEELQKGDAALLETARAITVQAYAPYSRFFVGASVKLDNGQLLSGTNQENASFPAGICAERTVLAAVSSVYPGAVIHAMAISFRSAGAASNHPISPCGICRQSLIEQEKRQQAPIRIILGGQVGPIFIISSMNHLLPFSFTGEELDKG
ncbi:cytidine deaminase [Flavihumibacter cheonanensis]|uniref:cytidine deaminase n=1 Tax=Flavihumibacter cheonanensis TaxID=1442385 RepID=UPI001EF82CBC|nr:cytidine deaminase [Flavihumibacter cheonanensis]MCG7751569.1 cytidine deaminase [Flavihumibacter cheonanensis]